jgi:predicted CXXCH cytochrome family protein
MRRTPAILTLWTAAVAISAACSQPTRHRILSFFFDGVPTPGQPGGEGAEGAADRSRAGEPVSPESRPRIRYYSHTPFRQNRCGGCHNPESGDLLKPIRQGLCTICHEELTKGAAFVHGPAAVNDCGVCHHPHAATHPNLLLIAPDATCFECHDRDDLSEGEHHALIDRTPCIDCHNPHASDNRFFLKRNQL